MNPAEQIGLQQGTEKAANRDDGGRGRFLTIEWNGNT